MTEATWLAETDPGALLFHLVDSSERKLRLLACAVSSLPQNRVPAEVMAHAVHLAERVADGSADERERAAFNDDRDADTAGYLPCGADAWASAFGALDLYTATPTIRDQITQATIHLLIRCVFGNPFRPVAVDPAWRTEAVVALARGIYEDRAFERLPVLADALEDAGCDDADILAHCRGIDPHVRGCWVVDLLTRRE